MVETGVGTADRVTKAFLFTDIVGSTAMWERFPEAMPDAIQRHDALLEAVVVARGGTVVHWAGDGLIASFSTVAAALDAAADVQRRLVEADWSAVDGLGVRSGVHRGPVVLRDGEPYGWALNFGARLTGVGGAGQILVSAAVVEELGASEKPNHEVAYLATVRLRDIAEPAEVYQLHVSGLPSRFPALRDSNAPVPLPVPPNELVGRTADLALLDRLTAANRLVTLVGPPGVGKSRLATELVNRSLDRAADGVVRVNLANTSVAAADLLAAALGVSPRGGSDALDSLSEWLASRRMLLLLDQADPAGGGVSGVVEDVLLSASNVSIICTSSRPLGVTGEVVHRVDPLGPDDAMRLIVGQTPDPLGKHDEAAVRELARELDGLPLALEVAAASAQLYSWNEILSLLRNEELERPDSPRHAIAVRVALGLQDLPSPLGDMLTATTAFAGSFDRSAFHSVCAPDVDTVTSDEALNELVERSLVARESTPERTQFRLLRTVADVVADYGADAARLGAERRLESWAADFTLEAADGLRGPDERLWNRRVVSQFGNLRGAYRRAVARGDLADAMTIATSLWDFGFMRFNAEYLSWSEELADRLAGGPPELLGPVLGVASLSAWIGDDAERAVAQARRALELESEHQLDFDLPARLALINAAVYSGAAVPPPEIYAESAEYQRSRPEAYFHVNLDTQNSVMARWQGDHDAAVRRAVRAVRVAREARNPSSLSFGLWALGGAFADVDPFYAETHLGTALELARDAGNRWVSALTQMSLVSLRHRTSGAMAATPILVDLLDLLQRGGHRTHLWSSLRLAGVILADLGDEDLAAQLLEWVRGVGLAMPPFPSDVALLDALEGRLREERGADWVSRMALMSETWTSDTAVALVRDTLARRLDAA